MNRFLAKSNPIETIQEHTDQLLENLEILKQTYPNLKVDWDMLETACIYHDLGKMNLKFQSKIEGDKRYENEIAHNLLSLAFLNNSEIKEKYSKNQRRLIALAVGNHHNRGDYDAKNYNDEVEQLKNEAINFKYKELSFDDIRPLSKRFFSKSDKPHINDLDFFDYIFLKGLLNRLDYAASSGIKVESQNDFLNEYLEVFKKKSNFNWNELQLFMKENQENNTVVIAQTGMGKTEAGLLWIGNNKGFFTLPLKTAINSMHRRIAEELLNKDYEKIGLLHSDTYSKYIEIQEHTKNLDIEKYVNKTRQLSLPLTICTIDQLFDVVFRYTDYEAKLATLSYSKIVIDEIQMYSADLIAYLIFGLKMIQIIGGRFAILTATLPPLVTYLLDEEIISYVKPDKEFINEMKRHKLKVVQENINIQEIINVKKNKVLVVCNTVKKAQELYEKLIDQGENANLLHSKFIQNDRNHKEEKIIEMGQKYSKETGIWITTQIVEASLDIDFDYLFTELSDLNSLFQRMGRCYRKRELDHKGYNCFVYIGSKIPCSGVGYVIDEDIHNFSKEALKNIDGIITEEHKQKLIKSTYAVEKIKKTNYFKEIQNYLSAIKSIPDYELGKKEVKKRFRNIDTVVVIPEPVYSSNKSLIDELVDDYQKLYDQESDKNRRQIEQRRILDSIKGFTVSLRREEIIRNQLFHIRINDYTEIPVFDCEYSSLEGVVIKSEKEKNCVFEDRNL